MTGEPVTEELIEMLTQHKMDLDIYHERITPELPQKLHDAGIFLNCWTVDDPVRAADLVSWGVDFITSNILH